MIGFRATDEDDDEPTPEVRDGVASERELSPAEHVELFVGLCERLRGMGAIEVRANEYRAVWPAPAQQLSVVPVVREKPKPERPAEPERLLPTDTPEDIARRERYAEIRKAATGEQ